MLTILLRFWIILMAGGTNLVSAGPWGSAEGPSPRERWAAFPSLSSAHTGGPRPFPSHAWSPWAAGGAQRSHLRRPTGLRSPISPRGAGRGALRGAVGAPATGNPSWGPHLEHVSVTLLWGPIWGPHLQHPVHIWVILLWGTHFGVLISLTQCILVTPLWSSHFGGPHLVHLVHVVLSVGAGPLGGQWVSGSGGAGAGPHHAVCGAGRRAGAGAQHGAR